MTAKRLPGRPRSEQARQAILRSTAEIAAAAPVSPISRSRPSPPTPAWARPPCIAGGPNKGALVVDAFASSAEDELHFPDSGSVYKDMSLQMNQFLAILAFATRPHCGGGDCAAVSPIRDLIEAFRERFLRPRRQEAYQTLRRGIERGELPRNLDLDLVLDILYGAIYMRFLIRHDELSEDYIADVCRLVLNGAIAGTDRTPGATGETLGRRQLASSAA